MKKNYNLVNKVVFVLGGNGLLGREITKSIADNGGKAIILDIVSNTKLLKKNIKFENFDLSKINRIEQNLKKISKKYGCPDVFINAAYPRTKLWKNASYKKLTVSELNKNVQIHLNSSIWSSMKIAELMKKNKKKGSIILLNSIYGLISQDKQIYLKTEIELNPVYSAIKGGLITFVRNLSSFYGEFGIRANSIICGGIRGHIAGKNKDQSSKFIKNYTKKTLIKRMGNPNDISSAVLFLASDDSSYITGSELKVDGGYTAI